MSRFGGPRHYNNPVHSYYFTAMLKNLVVSALLLVSFAFKTTAQDHAPAAPQAVEEKKVSLAEVKFEAYEHDFGTIKNGGNGVYEFKFTNTGKEPLIIVNAKGSCGCTVPSWPKEPIAPGASGAIKVSYDTKRTGPFTKGVTVMTNAKTETVALTIKGVVQEPEKDVTVPVRKADDGTPLANPPSKF